MSAERDERGNYVRQAGSTAEHRTVGDYRSWCHDCGQWCYPNAPCGEPRCCIVASVDLEALAEVAHGAYEVEAAASGWETNRASRVPWAQIPEANRRATRASVNAVLASLDVTL